MPAEDHAMILEQLNVSSTCQHLRASTGIATLIGLPLSRKLCTLTDFLSACKSIEYDHPLLKIVYSGPLLFTTLYSIKCLILARKFN